MKFKQKKPKAKVLRMPDPQDRELIYLNPEHPVNALVAKLINSEALTKLAGIVYGSLLMLKRLNHPDGRIPAQALLAMWFGMLSDREMEEALGELLEKELISLEDKCVILAGV